MSYAGSTGHDQSVQDESPAIGSPSDDDVTGPSSQDGNPPNDSRQSAPPEPVKKNDFNYW